jgi:uncharacterized membrane protein YphA (DoxX/SURF4 family)
MMEQLEIYMPSMALLFARVVLGSLFLYQGIDKVFNMGIENVSETYKNELKKSWIPSFVFPMTAIYSSYIELLGGILLIIGLFKSAVLLLLAFDLILVTLAMSTIAPLWDMRYVFPRMLLLILLMIVPSAVDLFSLDHLLK